MSTLQAKIVPFLWYDTQALEAAQLYTSIFKDSRIKTIHTVEGTPSGTIQEVAFELFGQEFMAMSAGPLFKFNESISFIVYCDTQEEIDEYWQALTTDGGQESECGWLKDKFGLSWQILPSTLNAMMSSGDPAKTGRVTQAFLQMKKLDIAALQRAYDGE